MVQTGLEPASFESEVRRSTIVPPYHEYLHVKKIDYTLLDFLQLPTWEFSGGFTLNFPAVLH